MTHHPTAPHARRTTTAGRSALAALLITTAAGCGISTTGPVTVGPPASGIQQPGTEARTVRLYFASPAGIRAVNRPVVRPLNPQQALDLLLEGPTPAEHERGLITQVPPMAGQLTATDTKGAVDIFIPYAVGTDDLDVTAVTQIVCTAAHANVLGDQPATQVDIRIHENLVRSRTPWTVRCGSNGNVTPVTEQPLSS